MMRTFALIGLAVLLVGCTRYQPRAQGPFAQTKQELPPPYGAVSPKNKPIANQSPLGIASADPARPPSPGDPSLIPPKASGILPASAEDSADPNGAPPFKRRPQSEPLPSPFSPKDQSKELPGDTPPPAPKAAGKDFTRLKDLLAAANDAWKAVDTYEATLTRREVNLKGQMTSDVLTYQFRREPMSVFTRNIGGGGKGREVVYNPGKHGDKLYVMLGEGDNKLLKAGFVAPPISPDDPKVAEKARHSIRDSGFGRNINLLNAVVAKIEAGKAPADSLTYLGGVTRDEYAYQLVGVTHALRPGDDPLMPSGGTRHYFFDIKKDSQSFGMPVLVVATEPNGKEVEYYLYEKVKSPANLTDADFNPARLGKK